MQTFTQVLLVRCPVPGGRLPANGPRHVTQVKVQNNKLLLKSKMCNQGNGGLSSFFTKDFFNALLQWCSPFTRTLGIFVNSQNIFKCKTEDPSQMLKK